MDPEALTEPVGQLVERLQSLPLEVHGVVGLTLVAGLLMWAWGWRVLKPMTVVVSALAGAYAASLVAPSLGLAENVKIEAIVLAGFALGSLAGLLVYRSAMALGCGVVVAVAAPLVASVVLAPESAGGDSEGQLALEEQYLNGVEVAYADYPEDLETGVQTRRVAAGIRDLMREATGTAANEESDAGLGAAALGNELPGDEAESGDDDSGPVARLKRFVGAVAEEAQVHWNALPERHRFVYGTASIAGLAVGVMIGLVLPGRAAGAVTSLFGAAVWLPCFVWLSGAWSMPWRDALGRLDGRGWLIVWGVASVTGMALQWRGMRRARRRNRGGDAEAG